MYEESMAINKGAHTLVQNIQWLCGLWIEGPQDWLVTSPPLLSSKTGDGELAHRSEKEDEGKRNKRPWHHNGGPFSLCYGALVEPSVCYRYLFLVPK